MCTEKMIVADAVGKELENLDRCIAVDLELGDTNDFECDINLNFWDKKKLNYGYMIYIPDTEYGGIIGDMKTITKQNAIKMTGDTWRGMLGKKIIEPPSGKDYLTVSGELNSILRNLIDGRFDGLFLVPQVDTGVIIQNFQFDRYCTLDGWNYRLFLQRC